MKVEDIFKKKLKEKTSYQEKTAEIIKDSVFRDSPPFKNLAVKIHKSDKKILNTIENILIEIMKEKIETIKENPDFLGEIKKLLSAIERVIFTLNNLQELEIEKLKEQVKEEDLKAKEREEEIIISFFKKLIGTPFQLTRYYKEVPVKCCAVLKQVIDRFAIFKLENYRYFILKEGEDVFISSPNLPSSVTGTVKHFHLEKEMVSIGFFRLSAPPQEKRKYLRVKPAEDIEVTIKKENKTYTGKLEDISIGGIGISTNKTDNLEVFDKVEIEFFLSGKIIKTTGEIKNRKENFGKIKLGIAFQNEKEYEEFIAKYIIKREVEILNEVKI
ncbi:PilZ domain-containing protein [Desulfurobacterium sp.]